MLHSKKCHIYHWNLKLSWFLPRKQKALTWVAWHPCCHLCSRKGMKGSRLDVVWAVWHFLRHAEWLHKQCCKTWMYVQIEMKLKVPFEGWPWPWIVHGRGSGLGQQPPDAISTQYGIHMPLEQYRHNALMFPNLRHDVPKSTHWFVENDSFFLRGIESNYVCSIWM